MIFVWNNKIHVHSHKKSKFYSNELRVSADGNEMIWST